MSESLRNIVSFLISLGDFVLSTFFCRRCLICERPFLTALCCNDCVEIVEIETPLQTVYLGQESLKVTSLLWYSTKTRRLWCHLKFRSQWGVLPLFERAVRCRQGLLTELFGDDHVLIPVPIAFFRYRKRGLNLSDWLAREIGSGTRIHRCFGLSRGKSGVPSSLLSRRQRFSNIKGKIKWNEKTVVPSKVILIDDIVTTGATLRECARILREAGVEEVQCWTLFRTPLKGELKSSPGILDGC